jgi:death-on-curing protein
MPEPIWLDEMQVAAIAHMTVARFGGLSGELRDENLLKAALGRPLNKWHYDEPKPDLFDLAAAYCFALSRGHAFHDGNKRTAYIAAIVFLELNGVVCAPAPEDIIRTMLSLAAGSLDEAELAAWFRENAEH